MKRLFGNGRYANVTATVALIVALGGTSYAAVALPKNSVRGKQIARNAVGSSEIKRGGVRTSEVRDGALLGADFKAGELPSGPAGPTGATGATGATGPRGPSDAFVARETDGAFKNLPQNTETSLGTLTVPSGKYVVWAKLLINSNVNTPTTTTCRLVGSSEEDNFADGLTIAPKGPTTARWRR